MLTRETVTVSISGNDYTIAEPTRRRARHLMAGALRILPKLQAAHEALRATGVSLESEGDVLAAVSRLDGDAAASMLDLYDPLCDWLQDALPALTADVTDDAPESDLVSAFVKIQEFLKRPLLKSGNAPQMNIPKPCAATPQSSTSEEATPIPTGKAESTN